MKKEPLLIILLGFLLCLQYPMNIFAQQIIPEINIKDYYDEDAYRQALNALEQNAKEIETDLKGDSIESYGRAPNSEGVLVPNQTMRKIQEEVPNHERNLNNSSQPLNQRSIPNNANRRPNQSSIMVK